MSSPEKKTRKSLLKRLKGAFSDLEKCEEVDLQTAYKLGTKKVRVPLKHYPIQVNIGESDNILHLYPEVPLADPAPTDPRSRHYILIDPARYFTDIAGFYRLDDGDKLILGKQTAHPDSFLRLPGEVSDRTLSISNEEGSLVFKAHDQAIQTCISPLIDKAACDRLQEWRLGKLRRLKTIFGGKIELLEPKPALKLIARVNDLMAEEPYRLPGKKGRPGGLLEFPDSLSPIIVGDLHTNVDNLLTLLSQNGFLEALESGSGCLILVGDAVHRDEGDLAEMQCSMFIMDLIFQLKLRFPKNVFYLRGNHDSFSHDIAKGGVPQGMLWEETLVKARGEAYRDAMAAYYRLLPYVAYSQTFIACHAGPPTSPVDKAALVDIHKHPQLIKELVNNRLKTTTRLAGYGKPHLKKLRKALGVAPETPVVVGHTPLSDDDTLWENPGQIENHTVVYGSDANWIGAMVGIGGRLFPLRFPAEKLIDFTNGL